jgi:hypothetical protein
MDELMQAIAERTGLPADKAQGAAEAAMDFFKEKLPGGLGEKLEDLIAGNTDAIADAAGTLADKAKGLFNS